MNRRSFLVALGVAPIAASGTTVAGAPKASDVAYSGEHGPEMVIPKARIGLHAKAEDQSASFFMEARADGCSRVLFRADQFHIRSPDLDGNRQLFPAA